MLVGDIFPVELNKSGWSWPFFRLLVSGDDQKKWPGAE